MDETRDASVRGDRSTVRSVMDETVTALPEEERAEAGSATRPPLPERYEDLCLLGRGGFGEVRRVYDRKLERVVAMKLLKHHIRDTPRLRARFLAEIKLTAGLHHPGIIAILDYGELEGGLLWFTMPEVRGRTLRAVFDEHVARPDDCRRDADAHIKRRRLLDLFARVCDAMAYAHSRGVIHRDLKPDNVMVGEFGRVMVMDWGLARRVGRGDLDCVEQPFDPRFPGGALSLDGLTQYGEIIGTPAYMPPEQARGDIRLHGPSADVYALGAILYHLLTGRKPCEDGALSVREAVLVRPLEALVSANAPRELAAICARAMSWDPEDRYADAGELAVEIEAFLSGARRRERALEKLNEALARGPAIDELRAHAAKLRIEAKELLSPWKPSDPVELKLPGWALEDEAERLDREAALGEIGWIQDVHGALAMDPELPEAHDALADHYREKLAAAERARRHEDAARCEVLLRAHDRGKHAAFLNGKGALTLLTDPPGARVRLERYVLRGRRLLPEDMGDLGPTPIVDLPLEKGSYRLRISAPGRVEVVYPVLIERGERWDGCPPGSRDPYPIPLPMLGDVDSDEVYVPAGWAWMGGDPDAPDSLPATRIFIDGFIAGRFPVTNEEYLAFLNDLVASGREAEALLACPRPHRGTVEGKEELSHARGPDGRFRLKEHDVGEVWTPRGPAVLMSWHGAMAYARWRGARAGRPYRLIHELEREKAIRGADGRLYPWGDFFDATWACMMHSHTGDIVRVDVDAYPLDESPYGMRGGAGNSHDYCVNLWSDDGRALHGGRLVIKPAPAEDDEFRAVRGGAFSSVANHCRAAARFGLRPDQRRNATGLRLSRPYP
jgi:serine/threonine-protein kinase